MATSKAQIRVERILSFDEARECVSGQAESLYQLPRQSEQVPILNSLGRTLAEEIIADRDFPPFPRATRDGYAVLAEDTRSIPAELRIVGQIRAGGELPTNFACLQRGQAVSIMTGAPVPRGADAVIMVEHAQSNRDAVRLLKSVTSGENIVPRGSEARAGSVLLSPGTRIAHPEIALAAAAGRSKFSVYSRPHVAILSTGDEVVPIESAPADNQIRNSNSFSLAAQVIAAGGEPVQLPIAPDEPTRLRELISQGLESDLLLLSGGVSSGEYDVVEDVLSDFSAEFLFTGVQIQPGKPLVFGRARCRHPSEHWTYFFGLPGNPISTMVTFELFASILVRALSGDTAHDPLRGTKARLGKELRTKTGLTRFLPAKVSGNWDDATVEPVKWQGSGDLAAFARADCLLVIPPDSEHFAPGEWMTVLPLHN
ncbi:MAG: molybdopterin molybdenumtransferase MoeA [Acidobacteria bacterium]|nr:MAG: molybdopterin molybdenumtransferase MoeA [Acidobacteriota bacterium]